MTRAESWYREDHVCPRCAYALAGLPMEGTCPECGSAYEPRMVVFQPINPWLAAWKLGWPLASVVALFAASWLAARALPPLGCVMVFFIFPALIAVPVNEAITSEELMRLHTSAGLRHRSRWTRLMAIGWPAVVVSGLNIAVSVAMFLTLVFVLSVTIFGR